MLEEIIHDREKKCSEYETSASAFPAVVKRSHHIKEVLAHFESFLKDEKKLSLVGRIFALRDQGGILFADAADESGKLQFVFNEKEIKDFSFIQKTLDNGDFIEAHGIPYETKRGEKSLLVRDARIIAKSLRPVPTTWYGLEDTEILLRSRYLDLLLHEDTKELFRKKTLFWETIRDYLKKEKYLEVEMPVLEPVPGGAEARPFVTHHNALDEDFYLRISLELPLKKMLVGGIEKVFEIGRIFRNEGIDREHLQDYTQMECYSAYENYDDMMKFVEGMYKEVIQKLFGTLSFRIQDADIDWGIQWPKVDYYEMFKKETGIDLNSATEEELKKKAKELGVFIEPQFKKGRIIDLIYKKTIRPQLIQPCFLVDPPVEIEPLAKRLEKDKNRVARFQILALGTELGKGFSELNDPRDQRARFEDQMKLREEGDEEAQMIDEEFIEALEYGMPPAAGFGMSERLFAVLMGRPIRETVVFPLMKKKE